MSIHAKILLPVSLGMLLLGVYLAGFWIPSDVDETQRHFKEIARFQLAALGETLVAPLQMNDVNQIHSILDRARLNNNNLQEISLVDGFGNELFSYGAPEGENEKNLGTYEYVIVYSGEQLGTLSVRTSTIPEMEDRVEVLRAQLLGAVLLAFLIIAAASLSVTEFSIRRRVQRLSEFARRLEEGDYHTSIPAGANDAIGQLTRALESMRDTLRNSYEDWQSQRQGLDAHSMVCIADRDRNVIYVNEKFRRITGYTDQELIGRNMLDLLGECQQKDDAVEDDHCGTITGPQPWSGESELINKYGRVYWTYTTIAPVLDENGDICQFVNIQTDMTEKKRSERVAEKHSQELTRLIDSSPVVLYSRCPAACNQLGYISANARDVLGYEPRELIGDPALWMRRTHPEEREKFWEVCGAERVSGEIGCVEYRFQRKDGCYIWLRDRFRIVENEARGEMEVVGALTDISAAREREREVVR